MNKTVYLGMSGGIDSSVSAYLLKEQGYNVKGIYLKLQDENCSHHFNIEKAKEVADRLNIEFQVLDYQKKFKEIIYNYFVNSYKEGLTPNPCAMCNREFKFGLLLDYALKNKADYVSTGHYVKTDGEFLYEGSEGKDQSYFLFYIKAEAIKNIIFPLQDYEKKDVMQIAKDKGFYNLADYKESNEVCFVDKNYVDVLSRHMDVNIPGKVLDLKGNEVGEHKGFMHYTIGKRKGFSVNGALDPHYVSFIDPKENKIIVAKKGEASTDELYLKDINMFDKKDSFDCEVRLRYRSKKVPCRVEIREDKAFIRLKDKVELIAPGQAAVFYEDKKLIGGGWISKDPNPLKAKT